MITNESYVILIHRIADECQGNRLNENLKVSKAKLEKFIVYQKKRGYTFISVAEFIENLDMKRRQRKVLVFTADDGYKDVIENGLQLFEHYEIPLTLFLVPNFLNKKIIPWWHVLEEYININIDNISLRELEFKKLREVFLNENYLGIERLFKIHYHATKEMNSNFRKEISNCFLSEKDIVSLKNHRLIDFGAHTMDHVNLVQCDESQQMNQIEGSRREISELVGREVISFAYPFGSKAEINNLSILNVKKSGFKIGFSNIYGDVTNLRHINKYAVPRLDLTNLIVDNYTNEIIKFKIISALNRVQNKIK